MVPYKSNNTVQSLQHGDIGGREGVAHTRENQWGTFVSDGGSFCGAKEQTIGIYQKNHGHAGSVQSMHEHRAKAAACRDSVCVWCAHRTEFHC